MSINDDAQRDIALDEDEAEGDWRTQDQARQALEREDDPDGGRLHAHPGNRDLAEHVHQRCCPGRRPQRAIGRPQRNGFLTSQPRSVATLRRKY